ncbi:SAM-dependent methyltransferase [Actinomadura verrucosospora]|uniref:SAM-dependent methyltransferase n=1 Tax=Actinomadura verrucosospora TaxID=46165 RepID=UPI0031EAC207
MAGAAATLDFDQPVALMLLGVLNHIVDDHQARQLVADLLAGLAPGSYLVISHTCDATTDALDGQAMRRAVQEVMDRGGTPIRARSPEQIQELFSGADLLERGVVSCSRWRPNPSHGPSVVGCIRPAKTEGPGPHVPGLGNRAPTQTSQRASALAAVSYSSSPHHPLAQRARRQPAVFRRTGDGAFATAACTFASSHCQPPPRASR